MTKLVTQALLVLSLSLISLTLDPRVAVAEEGAAYCEWCVDGCPSMPNHFCAGHASGCSAWLIPCTKGCTSIYGTEYTNKIDCGSSGEA